MVQCCCSTLYLSSSDFMISSKVVFPIHCRPTLVVQNCTYKKIQIFLPKAARKILFCCVTVTFPKLFTFLAKKVPSILFVGFWKKIHTFHKIHIHNQNNCALMAVFEIIQCFLVHFPFFLYFLWVMFKITWC